MKRFISRLTADDERERERADAHSHAIEPTEPMYELPLDRKAGLEAADDKDLDAKLDGRERATSVGVYDVELGEADEADEDKKVVKDASDIAQVIVDDRDDPTMPSLTFRTFFLGSGLAAFGSVLAEIYYFKPQGATVSVLFQLIIAYVLGNAMAKLPSRGWWRFINPGPFNIKEHTCITIFASTASTTAEAISIVAVLNLYYNLDLNPGVAILQTWGSQIIGYGFSGILQKMVVYPTYALWPANLPTISLLQSMHFGGMMNRKKMRFFWIVFAAIFLWEIVPTWMFPLLTAFSVICLADNGRHRFVRNLFGAGSSNEGLGLLSFGFDWTLISQAYPLFWPLQTQVNSWIGMALCYVVCIGAFYGGVGEAKQRGLPFMSTSLFSGNGSSYDQSAILDADGTLNATAYAEVGRPYYTATYLMSTTTHNLSCGAAVMHVILWHYKDIARGWKTFRGGRDEDIKDVHYEKMKVYKDVPQWWYLFMLVASLAIAMGTAYYGGQNTIPAWSVLIFTVIAFFFAVVLAFLQAVTGFNTSTKGIVQLVASYIHPGRPVANMYASLYGYSTSFQSLYLLSDQKLGQYAKVPPRATFVCQLGGTVLGAALNYVIYKSITDAHREVLLDPLGTRIWAGWNLQSTNSGALTWGALGRELYGAGKPYWFIPAALGFGLLGPIPFFVMHKLYPKQKFWGYLNMPIIFNYMGWLPYSVNGMWWPGFIIGMASQWWARTRRPRWFNKYNYLLSAALDGGSSIIYFILNFAVFGAAGQGVDFPTWWGNLDPSGNLAVDHCLAPGL